MPKPAISEIVLRDLNPIENELRWSRSAEAIRADVERHRSRIEVSSLADAALQVDNNSMRR
jgi:hypothetical protein